MDEKLKMLWDSDDEVNWLLVSVIFGEEKLLEYILDVYTELMRNNKVKRIKCGWFNFGVFGLLNGETYTRIKVKDRIAPPSWINHDEKIEYITKLYYELIKTKQE
jgi:hypothetical protein